ncbi:aldose epimerase family protein [Rhodovulum sulfidophilum]|uniref:aldose epimerase family protein n=1 Tax=Rhodovulum sulfidophilum TaxID=35806 RepID=UPI0013898678|nr:aldose epimerase family protein [Rhodovulum sulfidophilum]NDK34488.1 galactose mutarotase [Rhodovulum sulfidophilum]
MTSATDTALDTARSDGPATGRRPLGRAPDGSPVEALWIARAGTRARIMTWGATLMDLRLDGIGHSLVLGCPELAPYLGPMRDFGAVVGPVANRIAGASVPLGGRRLALEANEAGRTMLHGGPAGCSVRNWRIESESGTACRLGLSLPEGTGGLPGPLTLRASYSIDGEGALEILLEGESGALTFCNLAPHGYWCLDGSGALDAHLLEIAAGTYLPVDAALIPLGAPAPVAGTRFDFRRPRPVRAPGDAPLDHNFCLGDAPGRLRPACRLSVPGIALDLSSTEPGLQVYDGGGIDTGPFPGHQGRPYRAHAGLALEPQRWPDAPNRPDYPSVLLRPGETCRQLSRFHPRRIGAPGPG